MKLRDVISQIAIDPRKLVEYALNPNNESGGASKAAMFEQRLGFTQENYQILLEQIQSQALDAEASIGKADRYGQRYRVDLEIIGIEGQRETVLRGCFKGIKVATLRSIPPRTGSLSITQKSGKVNQKEGSSNGLCRVNRPVSDQF